MSERGQNSKVTLGGKAHENLEEYITGFLAAIRTHQRLTENSNLRVEVEPEGRIPLAQQILLR